MVGRWVHHALALTAIDAITLIAFTMFSEGFQSGSVLFACSTFAFKNGMAAARRRAVALPTKATTTDKKFFAAAAAEQIVAVPHASSCIEDARQVQKESVIIKIERCELDLSSQSRHFGIKLPLGPFFIMQLARWPCRVRPSD